MKDGFIRIAAATPDIRVADTIYNREQILNRILEAEKEKVRILVLPELCITGYTCGDLFLQDTLLRGAEEAVAWLLLKTKDSPVLTFVGAPVTFRGKLYNAAIAIYKGEILGVVPKSYIPNYSEYYEARYFASGKDSEEKLTGTHPIRVFSYAGCKDVLFGTRILYRHKRIHNLNVACEISEDLWVSNPPSVSHANAGATVIANLSASVEVTAKEDYRRNLISLQSAKCACAYIYADAGEGESTTDVVFSGHNVIAEYGTVLKESKRFVNELIYTEIDVDKLAEERRRMNTFTANEDYWIVEFDSAPEETPLSRNFAPTPFIPSNETKKKKRCEEVFTLQAMGLKKRLIHTGCKSAVLGLSGGLDSTLALLVTVRAFDLAGIERKNITAVTMPGFGTTDRTYQNALTLAKTLCVNLREIPIKESVLQHFSDIGHDPSVHDVTYENAQARERTQILMDIANKNGGLVIGTGDLSELALGWATYNGDHMSMYGVNGSVPKTLVRHLVNYVAENCDEWQIGNTENATSEDLKKALLDVLDTPVSPELLPPDEDGKIAQKTEDLVGPYELHDFYLYYMMRFCFPPAKIYRIARLAFNGKYTDEEILHWLKTFYRRFFAQQFKRSCVPDGPKVGTIALSPRGDLRMPSDACVTLWKQELEGIMI